MDEKFRSALRDGLGELGLQAAVSPGALALLEKFADRLLTWNQKVNLTAIVEPVEVAEKHLVDSLALLPELEGARTLLDIGSGAGIPGVPLACVEPGLQVTCCDAVAKKMAFVKAVSTELDLRVKALAVRAEGSPADEGLEPADVVVSRALADPDHWLPLGRAYLAPGGRLLAMLGRDADEQSLRRLGEENGLSLVSLRRFVLPRSRSERAIARFLAA